MASTTVLGGASDEHLLVGTVSGGDEKIVQEEVVTFVEDGDVLEKGLTSSPFRTYGQATSDALENSILGFLRRPVRMLGFQWPDSMIASSTAGILFEMNLPWDWIRRSMINEKLSGFKFLRTDFEIRVVVNAQPSQAGAMLVAWIPYAQQARYRPSSVFSWTGYPHVMLDLSQSTSVKLRVPYIMLESHFSLTDDGFRENSLGTIVGCVISPLRGGNPNVDGTVFVHAVNPSVEIPTGIPVREGPSGEVQCWHMKKKQKPLSQPVHVETVPEVIITPPKILETGAPFRRCGSFRVVSRAVEIQMDKEAKVGKKTGAISGALRSTAKAVNALGEIPVLTSLAKPAEWMLNIGAGVAGMFGFSKPQDPGVPTSAVLNFGRNIANYDGDSKAKCLGFASDNAVYMPKELYGDDNDQMSIPYVVQRSILVNSFVMTQTSAVDDVLYSTEVGIYMRPDDFVTPRSVSYCEYLGQLFRYWRGELIWHFQVIKTPLHSARVEVVYVPGFISGSYDQNRCYRQIVDLRERTSFEFRVPFVLNTPWCGTTSASDSSLIPHNTGIIEVRVLNQLRNPSICAPEIEFLVWKSAGPDFQFARPLFAPDDQLQSSVVHESIVTVENFVRSWDGVIGGPPSGEIQMDAVGHEETDVCPMPMHVSKMGDYDPNYLTFGEVVTSLRQYMKRNDFMSKNPLTGGGANGFQWSLFYSAGTVAPSSYNIYGHFGYISKLFRFMAGSLVVGFHNYHVTNGPAILVSIYTLSGNDVLPTETSSRWENDVPMVMLYTDLEKYAEVRVPHYYPRPARLTDTGHTVIAGDGTYAVGTPVLVVENAAGHLLSRFAGEDFSMGFLLPPPTMVKTAAPPP